MLVIGSRALAVYNHERVPHDWDLLCSRFEMNDVCKTLDCIPTQVNRFIWKTFKEGIGQIEFELTEESQSGQKYDNYFWFCEKHYNTYTILVPGWGYAFCATPPILLSMKKSHIFYPKNWDKHIKDYSFLKSILESDQLPEITAIRKSELEETQGKLKTPSLDQKAEDFFDDNVSNKTFVHDNIHEVMSHYDRPLFEYIKVDTEKVACSKDKFYALSQMERVQCVLEEAYVIALERAIIPFLFEGKKVANPKKAFDWAVMRICTTLCSGWFRQFAVDNWVEITSSYNPHYVEKFLRAVAEERIKRIDK